MFNFIPEYAVAASSWFQWVIHNSVLLWIVVVLYDLYCWWLLKVGHDDRKSAEFLPEGYFTMLAASLLPLTVTGVARSDVFLIVTRGATLFVVLWVYAHVARRNGNLDWQKDRGKIFATVLLLTLPVVAWAQFPAIHSTLVAYDRYIEWLAVGVMVLFVWKGQGVAFTTLLGRMAKGEYTLKGSGIQVVRFSAFALQAVHYGVVYGLTDTIFLVCLFGAVGATRILGLYVRILTRIFGRKTPEAGATT